MPIDWSNHGNALAPISLEFRRQLALGTSPHPKTRLPIYLGTYTDAPADNIRILISAYYAQEKWDGWTESIPKSVQIITFKDKSGFYRAIPCYQPNSNSPITEDFLFPSLAEVFTDPKEKKIYSPMAAIWALGEAAERAVAKMVYGKLEDRYSGPTMEELFKFT